MQRIDSEDNGEEGGFALLAVLGFMLLLALVLAPLAASSRIKVLTVSYEYDQTRLGTASEAINSYLGWRLANDDAWRRSVEADNFSELDCSIGTVIARISIVPHARLINLNTAEEPLLVAGLDKLGLGASDASNLAVKITKFRSPRPTEGEDETGVDAGFKHASFEDIAELHDFEALRGFGLADLGRVFSAQSGQAILSKSNDGVGKSQNFTIETLLFDDDAWGGDATVFLSGDKTAGSGRIAAIEIRGKPARPEHPGTCGSILNQDVVKLLAEVLA